MVREHLGNGVEPALLLLPLLETFPPAFQEVVVVGRAVPCELHRQLNLPTGACSRRVVSVGWVLSVLRCAYATMRVEAPITNWADCTCTVIL